MIVAECCLNYIHMLIRIPPQYSGSEIVGYLKSSFIIFDSHTNLKYKYENRIF